MSATATSDTKATAAAFVAANNNNKKPTKKINWIVRKSNLNDRSKVNQLLQLSYENLLIDDYSSEILNIVLPKMCTANDELLTSGTWYVVEHPTTHQLVGCGGWTPFNPLKKMKSLTETKTKIDPDSNFDDSTTKDQDPNHDDDNDNYSHLRHFGTDPNYKRQGIGRAIWDQCWKDVLEYFNSNPQTMEVISTITAESFYGSLGFQKVHDMSIPFIKSSTTTKCCCDGTKHKSASSSSSSDDENKNDDSCDFPCILMRREIE